MKASDRSYPLTDIGDATDSLDLPEPFALFRISGNKDNLIDYLMERINQAFNECPAKVRKKILLLPVCTPGFTTNQYRLQISMRYSVHTIFTSADMFRAGILHEYTLSDRCRLTSPPCVILSFP